MKYFILLLGALSISCSHHNVTNLSNNKLTFNNIKSDYVVTDINHYDCGPIGQSVLEHVLLTGIKITPRDEHDHYSTTGCSIKGSLKINDQFVEFTFDYGGLFYIGENLILGCAEVCCANEFEYCTWEPNGLK